MRDAVGAADRAQKSRIDAADHERAIDQRQRQEADGRIAVDDQKLVGIHLGRGFAEQEGHQLVDVDALDASR